MGILEKQNKKEITIENIIENKKKEKEKLDDLAQDKNVEKGEEEIIDFLLDKNKKLIIFKRVFEFIFLEII